MISLGVSVIMAPGSCHKAHIVFEPLALGVLSTIPSYASYQDARTHGIERVFSSHHAVMVVCSTLAPQMLLAVIDHVADDRTALGASASPARATQAHDRPRVRRFGRLESLDLPEIADNIAGVVIPVYLKTRPPAIPTRSTRP